MVKMVRHPESKPLSVQASRVQAARLPVSKRPDLRRPECKHPGFQCPSIQSSSVKSPTLQVSKRPDIQSPRVQGSRVQSSKFWASRPCVQSTAFPVNLMKHLYSWRRTLGSEAISDNKNSFKNEEKKKKIHVKSTFRS